MDVAPYVWIAEPAPGASEAAPRAATDAEDARLQRWAKPRGAALVRPAPGARSLAPADSAWIDATETDLATAREALGAADVATVEGALTRAEARLVAHPELAAAAWLRAEVLRVWAMRFLRVAPRDEAKASLAWRHAASLDGGRVAGVGESSLGVPEMRAVRIEWKHAPGVTLRIDGVPVASSSITLGEGEHAIVIDQGGETKLAQWMTPEHGVLALPDFVALPCSLADLGAVRFRDDAIDARGVACPRYFVVVDTRHEIAQCRGARCGAPARFGSPPAALVVVPDAPPPAAATSSSWLTWSAVGAAALLAGGSFFLASGVLDKPERRERWVSGGLRTE